MKKEFKVGQRVWIKDMKEFGTIVEIKGDGYHSDLEGGIDFSHFDNIHQTADDMFKELGYHIIKNDKDYLTYKTIYNYSIQFYKFNKEYFVGMYDDVFNQNTEGELCSITLDEHQAIHQKLIELGWIE